MDKAPSLETIRKIQFSLADELGPEQFTVYRRLEDKKLCHIMDVAFNSQTKKYFVIYITSTFEGRSVSFICEYENFLEQFERVN